MEDTESNHQHDDQEEFHEAFDESPFYDCEETFPQSIQSTDDKISVKDAIRLPDGIRRRRSISRYKSSVASSMESSKLSSSASLGNYSNSRKRNSKLSRNIKECDLKHRKENAGDILSAENTTKIDECSNLTDENECRGSEDFAVNESTSGGNYEDRDANSSLLVLLAGMMIKAISFQVELSFKFFMFPIWLMYSLYMLVFDPFRLLNRGKECLIRIMEMMWNVLRVNVSPFVYEWFKEHRAIWKVGLKCGWGLLWSGYVCSVLVGLLLSSFIVGGLLVRSVVEEPIRMKKSLNFDYTEKSPLALVLIIGNSELQQDIYLGEKPEIGKYGGSRVVPPNHKLKVAVSLTLPESDYNQNLGIFQVRVDFLASDGRILASSRRPCILQYRSQPIRLLLTFLKAAPILTGYLSESQDLKIKFKGFTEGVIPTSSLRVVIEQRAEFKPGAGIPEIYAASLTLQSELPFLKKVIWFWKKSLFVWISMTIFTMELLFALLCCKSIIIPKIKLREEPINGGAPQIGRPEQG